MESILTCRFCGTSNAEYARDRRGNIITDRYGNPQYTKASVTRSYYRCKSCGYTLCGDCLYSLKTKRVERHVVKANKEWHACPQCGSELVNIASASGGGGCFITTATLQSLNNNDDNCYELTTFRKFRDSWLKDNHPEDIQEYYRVAPSIVDGIDSLKNSKEVYQNVWQKYLQQCMKHIEANENEEAYTLYKQMVNELSCFSKN